MTDGGSVVVAEPAQLPATSQPEPNSLLPAIIKASRDASVDVAKMEAMMRMQRELQADEARREAIEAFTRMSADLPRVKKNGTIDLGKGKPIAFARWEDMDQVIRPLLTREGFTLSFNSAMREGGGLVVTGELMHVSGHVRTATIPLPLDTGPGRNNLQAVGSTLSYGKRYCAEMLLNIVREGADDDGVKGGAEFVTPEQIEELQALIEETDADEQKFLAAAGAAHIGEIPAGAFTMAKNLLLSKRKKG